jgi:hypothetical protein
MATPTLQTIFAALMTIGLFGCATDDMSRHAAGRTPSVAYSQAQARESRMVQNERATASSSTGYRTVEGIVEQMDPNHLRIRESSGRQMRLHIDGTTKMDQNVRVGDRVVAAATARPSSGTYSPDTYGPNGSRLVQGENGSPGMVRGELVEMDGYRYVVREPNGMERNLQVDNTTALSRHLRTGDQVVAINAAPANSQYETDVYSIYRSADETPVQGEIVRTDSEGYIVRDAMGRDRRVRADSPTARTQDLRVGDRIVSDARITSEIHADSIERR